MGLSAPRTIYGVHSLTLYDRTTWLPFGIMKVLGQLSIALSGDFKDLYGGSSRYPWDSESGVLDCSLSGMIKEMPNFAFEKFLGASVSTATAEASGNVGTLTNKNGTSVMNASTGIASVAATGGDTADLKDGLYVVKATAATKVKVYCLSDVDFEKGTDATFFDDDLQVTTAEETITTGGTNALAAFGVTLTGGSGTIGMTIGDTAYFYVRKVNAGNSIITVGQSTAAFNSFGAFIAAQKKGSGDVFDIQLFNCKAIGLPISLKEQDWLGSDIKIKAMYDSAQDAVFKIRDIKGA